MEAFQTQGIKLPRLGLGTYRMQGDVCRAAVESALALGYRHIDTAEIYANEDAIGAAITSSGLPRASRRESQQANLDALSVKLDDDDRRKIAALPKDRRFVSPGFSPAWD